MQETKKNRISYPQYIAAGVTTLTAVLLFLILWFSSFSTTQAAANTPARPQLASIDPDDLLDPEEFIEPPKMVEDAGEPNPIEQQDDTPAPAPLGEPDKGPKNDRVSVSGPNTNPNNSAEKLVTQKDPSQLQHTNPSKKEEPDQKISSEMGNKFNRHNGTPNGKEVGTSGSSTDGTGSGAAQGHLDGKRKMLYCNNKVPVKVSTETRIIVKVWVNDKGRVTKAKCITNVKGNLAAKLEKESLGSTWTPKAGAPITEGTITWTIKPGVK